MKYKGYIDVDDTGYETITVYQGHLCLGPFLPDDIWLKLNADQIDLQPGLDDLIANGRNYR